MKRASKSLLKRGLRRAIQARAAASTRISPTYWGLEGESTLSLAGVELAGLAAEFGSPLHVVNLARLRDNARRFLAPVSASGPSCEVFYSYKTNPVPGVLAELHRCGIGAEVISDYELWLALELGVAPSRIVYNGPAKSEASIRRAIELDIGLLNLNHREEIAVAARLAAQLGRRARVGLRITQSGWAGQFGVAVDGGQALAAFEEALRCPSLEVVGMHVHRGGMIRGSGEVVTFVTGMLGFADELREKLGLKLQILDLGGSLGSRSVRSLGARELRLNRTFLRELEAPAPADALAIESYTSTVLSLVADHYARCHEPAPRIFLEPGRSLTSDAQLLLTRVLGLKSQPDAVFAICDAGINVAESCRAEYHEMFPIRDHRRKATQTYTIVGPICTPGDTLRWALRLPELSVGDTLAIMDAGAYFVPFSTSFSFPRPGIVAVDDGRVIPLRRAETFEDLRMLDLETVGAPRRSS